MYRKILICVAVLGLTVALASAGPTRNPDGSVTCNATGADGSCDVTGPTEFSIICSGGMSSERGGGDTCSPGPAAAPLKLKHQPAKPGLRRRGR